MDSPLGKNGFLRCSAGHRVQAVVERPAWQMALFSFLLALWFLLVAIHLVLFALPEPKATLITWLLLGGVAFWSAYLVVRGKGLLHFPQPMIQIGRQYVIIGISRLVAVSLVAWLQATHILT